MTAPTYLHSQKLQLAKMDLSRAYARQVPEEIRKAKQAYARLLLRATEKRMQVRRAA